MVKRSMLGDGPQSSLHPDEVPFIVTPYLLMLMLTVVGIFEGITLGV